MADSLQYDNLRQGGSRLLQLPATVLDKIFRMFVKMGSPMSLNTIDTRAGSCHIGDLKLLSRELTACRYFWYAARDMFQSNEFILDVVPLIFPPRTITFEGESWLNVAAGRFESEQYQQTVDMLTLDRLRKMTTVIRCLTVRVRLDGTYQLRGLDMVDYTPTTPRGQPHIAMAPRNGNIRVQVAVIVRTLTELGYAFRKDLELKRLTFDFYFYRGPDGYPRRADGRRGAVLGPLPPVGAHEARMQHIHLRWNAQLVLLMLAVVFEHSADGCGEVEAGTVIIKASVGVESYYGRPSEESGRWEPSLILRQGVMSDVVKVIKGEGDESAGNLIPKWTDRILDEYQDRDELRLAYAEWLRHDEE